MLTDAELLAMILANEGRTYTNDPHDAGGPTKFGITLAVLREYRGDPSLTPDAVRDLQQADAEEIYRYRYIRPFDRLPRAMFRANVIDMGVNAGTARAARLAQQVLGVDVDGVIGPATATAAHSLALDWNQCYTFARIIFYESLIERKPEQIKWRRGWRARALRFIATPTARTLIMPVYERVGKAA